MSVDATKIYGGPIVAMGIAATATGDDGEFTDLGALDEESAALIEWIPNVAGLSDSNKVPINGTGVATFVLLQTDPAGILATLETYETALAKLKITTIDSTNGYHFIASVFINYKVIRDFKPGGIHKVEVTVSRTTEHADDFCSGPKAAS